MYLIYFTDEAIANQERLAIASSVQERITKKISWLAENFAQINPLPLSANLVGLFKLRVGDYRVIYAVDDDLKVITIYQIGHRREIYD
ncbi:type II toxin-antitoxin system RelE/ParE family toxin [[Phormidium] sp. ETS-05]|uniref:type II toxin-antitoxin system RelE family toxin n=1 Tax=[Phormidium] sp. ETS-05 TaxID=222819 RepID=UPI0018EED4DA|nr:type II toxin-antitoxin system RelE/ParE family toxin [[Phormidium] sp. ETS-05]